MLKIYLMMTLVPVLLFVAMVGAQQLGVRLRRRYGMDTEDSEGLGVIDAAVFGLMGLLLAFAFSGAAGRFDERRKLVIQESNDIGTAWLRVDLLSPADQKPMRELFRAYLDLRIETFAHVKDRTIFERDLAEASALQSKIWALAVEASPRGASSAAMLLLPALNAMFDTCSERAGVMLIHAPGQIFVLLIAVMVLCQMLAGYRFGASSNWSTLHRLAFAVILTVTYYVIVDLEYPRYGMVRVDEMDQLLAQLRQSMGP